MYNTINYNVLAVLLLLHIVLADSAVLVSARSSLLRFLILSQSWIVSKAAKLILKGTWTFLGMLEPYNFVISNVDIAWGTKMEASATVHRL